MSLPPWLHSPRGVYGLPIARLGAEVAHYGHLLWASGWAEVAVPSRVGCRLVVTAAAAPVSRVVPASFLEAPSPNLDRTSVPWPTVAPTGFSARNEMGARLACVGSTEGDSSGVSG